MEHFKHLLTSYFGPLNDQELDMIQSYFYEEKLTKNSFFTKTDKVCDKLSIIKSGILRIYSLSEGKEITQWIASENYMMTEVLGFFFDRPNRWNIQAYNDVDLWTIAKTDYLKLCRDFPKWIDIEKQLMLKCFVMIENRIFAHLSMTAQERYEMYFEQNSLLFNKVPLQHIASVLGMSPETLSRIRKHHAQTS
ncbi:Crp/Fnr family transcriptional regulator [Anditalea andensis]|uniref:Cyclic nucleotide-binding protein n=1 Tax=Anditalea andensis TaxID=1048983 RepID=A0A074L4T5_9BACT|nr:Crp/Fnr family transcriptional regulator [Anditalea andensis]KEO75500.1 cyclic nucleotide-binding protein [Anditalea andensis]